MRPKHIATFFLPLLIMVLLAPRLVSAATCSDGTESQFIPCECLVGNAENCGLNSLVQLFANLYSFSLKYLGALALLLFIIGGIMFLTSGGNPERVTRARNVLVGTTIGLMIVLGSYVIVLQVQKIIGVRGTYQLEPSASNTEACQAIGGECVICLDSTGHEIACTEPNQYSSVCTFTPGLCPGGTEQMCCVRTTPAP